MEESLQDSDEPGNDCPPVKFRRPVTKGAREPQSRWGRRAVRRKSNGARTCRTTSHSLGSWPGSVHSGRFWKNNAVAASRASQDRSGPRVSLSPCFLCVHAGSVVEAAFRDRTGLPAVKDFFTALLGFFQMGNPSQRQTELLRCLRSPAEAGGTGVFAPHNRRRPALRLLRRMAGKITPRRNPGSQVRNGYPGDRLKPVLPRADALDWVPHATGFNPCVQSSSATVWTLRR